MISICANSKKGLKSMGAKAGLHFIQKHDSYSRYKFIHVLVCYCRNTMSMHVKSGAVTIVSHCALLQRKQRRCTTGHLSHCNSFKDGVLVDEMNFKWVFKGKFFKYDFFITTVYKGLKIYTIVIKKIVIEIYYLSYLKYIYFNNHNRIWNIFMHPSPHPPPLLFFQIPLRHP